MATGASRTHPASVRTWMLVACLLAGTAAIAKEAAESKIAGGPYTLQVTRIAGGAGTTAGAGLSLSGTVGQHDATVVSAQGGSYEVEGGVIPAAPVGPPPGNTIFANSFEQD